jgi:hypothetical protein
MANIRFNVNTDATIALTAKLERLNRSAFPNAVRSTLNDAAFHMKKKEILKSAKLNMTVRNRGLFKKFTGVQKATGYNLNSMQAVVGFVPKEGVKGGKVPEGMEKNEVGGTDNTGAMYVPTSRQQNRYDKNKLAKNHTKRVRTRGGQSSVMALMAGWEEGKPVFFRSKKGIGYVVEVLRVFDMSTGKRDFKLNFLMRSRKEKPSKMKATHFVEEAAKKTIKNEIDDFYSTNATYQFQKVLK